MGTGTIRGGTLKQFDLADMFQFDNITRPKFTSTAIFFLTIDYRRFFREIIFYLAAGGHFASKLQQLAKRDVLSPYSDLLHGNSLSKLVLPASPGAR
jgi:hypothetical protein